MQQQMLDFDGDSLRKHLHARGVVARLQVELIVLATKTVPLTVIEDEKFLVLIISERGLAAKLNASRGGIRDALERLERRGILRRRAGVVVFSWDTIVELPEVNELDDLLARAVVGGSLDPNRRSIDSSNQPYQSKPKALPFALKWRHLFTETGQLNRRGITRLHQTAVEIGWVTHDFATTLALVMYARSRDAQDDGIRKPLAWLVATLRDGRKMSWPGEDYFEKARRLNGKTTATV